MGGFARERIGEAVHPHDAGCSSVALCGPLWFIRLWAQSHRGPLW